MNQTTTILLTGCLLCFCSTSGLAQSTQVHVIRSYGLAVPTDQVYLRSSVDGRVETIHFTEGQFLDKGDVVVELESRAAQARKKIAKLEAEATGQLQHAHAEWAAAVARHQRYVTLMNQNATSVQELNDANLRLQRAKAAVKIEQERLAANRARFELAEAELEQYVLRAPFAGQVTQVQTSAGAAVTETEDLIQIVSLDSFRVELFLPISRANELKAGQFIQTRVNASIQQIVEARVVFCSPMIEAATGTTRVVLEIDNRELNLPAGLNVSLYEPPNAPKTVAVRRLND